MSEKKLVAQTVNILKEDGWEVTTEVANLYRSADIAAINKAGEVMVVECKISNIKQALRQVNTHKISADIVSICTPYKKMNEKTIELIKDSKVGLMYMMPDGTLKQEIEPEKSSVIWPAARERLYNRILVGLEE